MSPSAISTARPVWNIPLDYRVDDSENSARKLVYALRPEWESSPGPLEFIRFKDGITNTLFKAVKKRPGASADEVDDEAVLLRAYGNGTAVLIDREREAQVHSLLARYRLAPALLARFNNGLLYRFIAGDACTPADLRRPDIWPSTARRLGQWHAVLPVAEAVATPGIRDADRDDIFWGHPAKLANGLHPNAHLIALLPHGTPTPNLWTVLQKWIRALPSRNAADKERNATLQTELEYATGRLGGTQGLDQGAYIMCHCDLLSGNVIVRPDGARRDAAGRVRQDVSFIDYEYTTPGPAAFDLANHLSEWGGFDCEYDVLPTREQRHGFVREYVASYRAEQRGNADEAGAADKDAASMPGFEADVDRLASEVDEFRGMPGLYWGVWALIQAEISSIDFDYVTYAERRLGEYWGWKDRADNVRERRWAQEHE